MSQDDNHPKSDTPAPREPPGTDDPSIEQDETPTPEVVDGDFDIFEAALDGETEKEEPITIPAD